MFACWSSCFFTHVNEQVPTVAPKTPTRSVWPGDSHPAAHQRLLSPRALAAQTVLRFYGPSVFKRASQHPKTREELFHNFVKIFLPLLQIGYLLSWYKRALILSVDKIGAFPLAQSAYDSARTSLSPPAASSLVPEDASQAELRAALQKQQMEMEGLRAQLEARKLSDKGAVPDLTLNGIAEFLGRDKIPHWMW